MITIDLVAVEELLVKMNATLFVVSIAMFVPAMWLDSIHKSDISEAICEYSAIAFAVAIVGFLILVVIAVLKIIWSV